MLKFVKRHRALVQQYGWRWCLFRFGYEARRRSGLLKRKFPAWRWQDRPLSHWLSPGVPAGPEAYVQYRQSNAPGFFFPAGRPPQPPRRWLTSAIEEAEGILQGRFRYFSRLAGQLGYPDTDWLRNPFTGQAASAGEHWCDRAVYDPALGDIKYFWEPSRFGWAYALVRAYAATGEEKYPEAFWRLLESWMVANPPQMGPNWQCGQEIALRALACTFALQGFWGCRATTAPRIAALLAMLAGSGERIARNTNYARSQMGNHATSEAAGLYSLGTVFPEFSQAKHWRQLGRWVLEDEVRHYNWPDGSYTQHSMNYQRLMLHAYLWCLRLAEINGDSFSDLAKDRLRMSYEFLYQLQDGHTGRLPNYGPNDGAMVLPLNSCDYLDYRPVIGSMHMLFARRRLYEVGPWSEDLIWLFGHDALQAPEVPLPRKSEVFLSGGYFTIRGRESWAAVRCHTYRSRPNQADMLHLDLWWKGVNLLRDSGSFSYYDPQRQWHLYFVSTAAHNTVIVAGQEQLIKGPRFSWSSLLESSFLGHFRQGPLELWQGEHYGYRRLPCRATHRRTICRLADDYWLVIDDVTAVGPGHVELFWHLPDVPFTAEQNVVAVDTHAGRAYLTVVCGGEFKLRVQRGLEDGRRTGWQSLYYGERTAAPTVCAETESAFPVRFVTLLSFNRPAQVRRWQPRSLLAWEAEAGPAVEVKLTPPEAAGRVVESIQYGSLCPWELPLRSKATAGR